MFFKIQYIFLRIKVLHNEDLQWNPIWDILWTLSSVISAQKIHNHIFDSDDVIHRRFILLYYYLRSL